MHTRGARFNRLQRLIDCLLRIDSQSRGEVSNRLIVQQYLWRNNNSSTCKYQCESPLLCFEMAECEQEPSSSDKSSSPEELYVQCVAVLRILSGKWSYQDHSCVSRQQMLFSQRTVVNDNQRWASTLLLALVIEVLFHLLHCIVAHPILTVKVTN